MSTRALYTFKAEDKGAHDWNVYYHYDGYPAGAAKHIKAAIKGPTWELPRYEADEFAAGFIAANKRHPGGVRLMPQGEPLRVAAANCGDIEYRYEVYRVFGNTSTPELRCTAYQVVGRDDVLVDRKLFDCAVEHLSEAASEYDSRLAEGERT